MNQTLSCFYFVPEKEAKQRLENITCLPNETPIHPNNKNNLNSMKDVIIQNMFLQKKYNCQKRKINLYEKINSYPSGIIGLRTASRAFFKLTELAAFFPDFISQQKPMNFLSLAEAPGGFMQSLMHLRDKDENGKMWSVFDEFIGISMKPDAGTDSYPKWSQIVEKNCRTKLFFGDISNENECKEIIPNRSYDMVTADCGIDISNNFHQQESTIYPFLLRQCALMLQFIRRGGVFVLKIFETDLYHTKELLFLLGCIFKQVLIVKPRTSRPLNSERYLICRNCRIDQSQRIHISNILIQYQSRINLYKGVLWKQTIPEEMMFLYHEYSRYCKEITIKHLSLITKKIDDSVIRLQYVYAKQFAKEFDLPIHSNILHQC